jgi:hypothetical protein
LNADGLSLDLQFATDKTLTARKGPTPTFTRASAATFVGSDGLIQSAAINQARFDHTSAGVCRGLLLEESRTNLVFPSDALTTQTRTVTAVAHTLSFYGTGTVVLSGTHSATVVGTGAYPTRTTLTFTPTAGSLTLTVTGSVTQAQLEAGSFATSYIPTVASSVVRSADVCSITGANFTSFYNQSEGTFFAAADPRMSTGGASYLGVNTGTNATGISIFRNATHNSFAVASGGSYTANISVASTNGSFNKIAGSYFANDARAAFNGSLGTADTSVTVSTNLIRLNVGSGGSANSDFANGCISSIRYFKKRLSNAKLQALTA